MTTAKPIAAFFLLGAFGVLMPGSMVADSALPQVVGTETADTQISNPKYSSAGSQIGSIQRNTIDRARLWGLSAEEWSRYEILKQGIRGSIAPNSSPIEVLGISARTPEERDRYAEMWAQMLHDDTDNVLAFQRAHEAAWDRLGFTRTLFGKPPESVASSPVPEIQYQDRLLFFAAPDKQCPRCMTTLTRALDLIKARRISRLDIYLLDQTDNAAVVEWARIHRIDPDLVMGRQVTLNHDNGTLARLAPGVTATPYLIRKRGVSLAAIEPGALR